ncbi:hypothetical protein GCM10023347_03150 [Streptomyces chumphonensis]|uniref:Uncharacterized protein n=1 Tax=Streptomyces chumphonensis TaxID=1214925 RepID=A0A927F6B9_9ACTN|nr:hypothetical protein [Streptomyces chumphonensis]MBD3934924.1 hypothetical protein [Streptomyces chumphonensis]
MSLFLFLLLIAVVLGFLGVLIDGLFYLLIIGVVVFLGAVLILGLRMGRRRTPR